MNIQRRSFITAAIGLIAAPAVVSAENLMKIAGSVAELEYKLHNSWSVNFSVENGLWLAKRIKTKFAYDYFNDDVVIGKELKLSEAPFPLGSGG